MPSPEPEEWRAHILHGSVSFQRRTIELPASIYVLAEVHYPERHNGRIVRIELSHEYVVAALINELAHTLREKGHILPKTMG